MHGSAATSSSCMTHEPTTPAHLEEVLFYDGLGATAIGTAQADGAAKAGRLVVQKNIVVER